ncbi:MAG: VWA domain-containing protein, partial [Rikenellaceae bacterium]
SSFVGERFGDRIALVVFAGESFTQSPLTTDQSSLQTMLGRVRSAVGLIDDGTAIGDGLATSLNRLRESSAKSKVIILLTDGVNNSGSIAPMTAAALAKDMGVKLYTIGVGTRGTAPYPRVNAYGDIVDYVPVKVEIDEEMLRNMAETTGGEYFRATNNQALEAIYKQINTLEKSEVEISERTLYSEEFFIYLLIAFALVCAESLIRMFIIKRLP